MVATSISTEGLKIYFNTTLNKWMYEGKGIKLRIGLFICRVKASYQVRTKNPVPYIKHFLMIFYWNSVAGYCRSCGRQIHDYVVPNQIWKDVTGWKNGEGLLCYRCFCKLSDKKGIYYRLMDKNFDGAIR